MGSGPGHDVFLLSKLVGPDGSVVGMDMIPKMIQRGESMIDYHREKYGYSNVEFRQVKSIAMIPFLRFFTRRWEQLVGIWCK